MSRGRIAVAALSLSAAAFVGILTREGYTDRAVIPVPGDVPTYGFGTTEGVRMGDTTTPVEAVQRALNDASKYEGALKRCARPSRKSCARPAFPAKCMAGPSTCGPSIARWCSATSLTKRFTI